MAIIVSALWGLNNGSTGDTETDLVITDVTAVAIKKYQGGTRTFEPNEEFWGTDPDLGKTKTLFMLWQDPPGSPLYGAAVHDGTSAVITLG